MTATNKSEMYGGSFNGLKWGIVAALVAGGAVGNSYYADEALLYRVLALVAVALVAATVAFQTTQGRAFWQLAREARVEIRKVVWPKPQERLQVTLLVLALVFVTSLILWGLDALLGWMVSSLIG